MTAYRRERVAARLAGTPSQGVAQRSPKGAAAAARGASWISKRDCRLRRLCRLCRLCRPRPCPELNSLLEACDKETRSRAELQYKQSYLTSSHPIRYSPVMAATQPPTSPTLPVTTTPAPTPPATNSLDDTMLVDEDAEGEDQLIDDIMPDPVSSVPEHLLSTRSTPALQHPSPEHGKAPAQKRRRVPESPPQVLLEKSAKKREQREREKEQQKYLLNKLIEIFGMWQLASLTYCSTHHLTRAEEGGGTCAVQQGQKKFPWVELPAQLIKINSYFAGWPERCLPKMKREDRIDASTGPSQWSLKQKRAMEAQINKGAVKVLPRQPGLFSRSSCSLFLPVA